MPSESFASLKTEIAAAIVDIESDQAGSPTDRQRRVDILQGVVLGELALEKGRMISHEEAKKLMARWLV